MVLEMSNEELVGRLGWIGSRECSCQGGALRLHCNVPRGEQQRFTWDDLVGFGQGFECKVRGGAYGV
jgi:hypothetical protein